MWSAPSFNSSLSMNPQGDPSSAGRFQRLWRARFFVPLASSTLNLPRTNEVAILTMMS